MARIDNKKVKLKEGMKVIRPITDPAWNARQAGKRERMSKKERLRRRREYEAMIADVKREKGL